MSALADTALAHEFPSLDREGLVYLDSARDVADAAHRPRRDGRLLAHHRGSVHRGVYPLAAEATELSRARASASRAFVNWGVAETIFTRNMTEALNLVAYAWGDANVGPGDRVVVTEMEHHSNFVPWQRLALRRGAALAVVGVDDEGRLRRGARRAAGGRRRQGRRRRAHLQRGGHDRAARGDRAPRP